MSPKWHLFDEHFIALLVMFVPLTLLTTVVTRRLVALWCLAGPLILASGWVIAQVVETRSATRRERVHYAAPNGCVIFGTLASAVGLAVFVERLR